MVYIYTLSFPFGNVRYIGKTNNLSKRLYRHKTATHKTPCTDWIYSLIEKGQMPIMEVLDIVEENEWCFWEKFYISLFKSWGISLLNISAGGYDKATTTKRKMSAYRKGRTISLDHKEKLKKAENHKKRTPETFEKIRKSLTGVKHSEDRILRKRKLSAGKSKLSKSDVVFIFRSVLSQMELAVKFKINQSDVSNIKNKKRFKIYTHNL